MILKRRQNNWTRTVITMHGWILTSPTISMGLVKKKSPTKTMITSACFRAYAGTHNYFILSRQWCQCKMSLFTSSSFVKVEVVEIVGYSCYWIVYLVKVVSCWLYRLKCNYSFPIKSYYYYFTISGQLLPLREGTIQRSLLWTRP